MSETSRRAIGILMFIILVITTIIKVMREIHTEVPIMFEENPGGGTLCGDGDSFVDSISPKFNERLIKKNDLCLKCNKNPRGSTNEDDWKNTWDYILGKWEQVEKTVLGRTYRSIKYLIFPHVPIPLSFILGASVDLRRTVKLYHYQDMLFYCVLDIRSRSCLFPNKVSRRCPAPRTSDNFSVNPKPKNEKKVDVYIIIGRHEFEPTRYTHDCYYYWAKYDDLKPGINWLPYVQNIISKVNKIITKYDEVNIRLVVPSVVAFALGMAFSRNQNITVSTFLNSDYHTIFSFKYIETDYPLGGKNKRLPFT